MSFRANELQLENERLKFEIQKLQEAIGDISTEITTPSSS
jgi:hypothetical protein